MYPLHSDGLSTGFPSRSSVFLSFVPPEYTQSFSTILSFAEHLLLRGNFISKLYSSYLSRASSAFKLFEAGLRPLELSLSGQQHLQGIRGRASAPRVISLGPAAPSRHSRQGFGPSNYLFRASSAFRIFEAGLRSLELSLSGQQRLRDIQSQASDLRVAFSAQ
jgi:hypothetical protein